MAIVDLSKGEVETNITDGVEFSFSKESASKLYLMMSDYLYSDKEYAVVSELAANAVDAHAMVGKKSVPINIQLPTQLDSEFVVRDYGPGMAEQDVYKFLTSYGESSKTDSNDQIGFWGIGSKSPAAITDNWTVVSHHDGKKMQFEVFITAKGIPTLKKIFETATDETGLEIRIPVSTKNHSTWDTAAVKAFKHYDVRPVTNRDLFIPEVKISYEGNGWRYTCLDPRVSRRAGTIVTTMREYALDFQKISSELLDRVEGEQVYKAFNNSPNMILFFDVGDIDLSISREQIQYNAKTVKAVADKMILAYNELIAQIRDEIAPAINGTDYRTILSKVFNDKKVTVSILEAAVKGNKYNVEKIPQDFLSIKVVLNANNVPAVVYRNKVKSVKGSFNCWKSHVIGLSTRWNGNVPTNLLSISIKDKDRVVVVLRDVNDVYARLKYFIETCTDQSKYYLVVDRDIFGAELPIVKSSEFEKVPREKRGVNTAEKIKDHYIWMGKETFRRMEKGFDLKSSKLAAIKIDTATHPGISYSDTLRFKFLARDGYTVVGYKGETKLKSVEDALKEIKSRIEKEPTFKEKMEKDRVSAMCNVVAASSIINGVVDWEPNTKEWDEIMLPFKEAITAYKTAGRWETTGRSFVGNQYAEVRRLLDSNYMAETFDVGSVENALQKRYPMLVLISTMKYAYFSLEAKESLRRAGCDYVNMIDKGAV